MKIRWVAAVTAALTLALASAEAAADTCRAITGTVTTAQATGACPSPVGICFSGTLATNSALRGDTFFVVTSAAPDPLDPTKLLYEGTLTVTHPSGSVTTFDTQGTVDQLTGAFVETDVARSPDDVSLTITGTTNATLSAFRGTIAGELCALGVGGS